MKLRLATPAAVVLDTEDVVSLRAEDDTGTFGIWPRHARFLTTLPVTILTWRDAAGQEHHAAVREGVLIVEDGRIEIATRQAILDDDLVALERKVETVFLHEMQDEEAARTAARRMHLATMRQIQHVVTVARKSTMPNTTTVDRSRS